MHCITGETALAAMACASIMHGLDTLVAYAARVPPDDPMPEVDFVAHDDVDDGGFEELPQPPERPTLQRWRIPLLIVGALVAVAVVVLAIVVPGSSSTPTAASSPTASTPSAPTQTLDLDPTTGRVTPNRPASPLDFLDGLSRSEIEAARAECPRLAPTCTTTGEAPTEVLDAVHAAFPRATRLRVLSDVAYQISSGGMLAYRRISARFAMTNIAVEIRAPNASDTTRVGVSYHGGQIYATAETRMNGLTVEVQASEPRPRTPSVGAVQRLAADRRLLATG